MLAIGIWGYLNGKLVHPVTPNSEVLVIEVVDSNVPENVAYMPSTGESYIIVNRGLMHPIHTRKVNEELDEHDMIKHCEEFKEVAEKYLEVRK